MTERTTVRLPEGLMDLARKKAAAEGRTLTAIIEEGVSRVVSEPKPERQRRVVLPVSKAKGGPAPGIDITNSAALQEMEDLEYIERLKRGFK